MAGKIPEHSAPNPQAAAGSKAEVSMERSSNREIRAASNFHLSWSSKPGAGAEFV